MTKLVGIVDDTRRFLSPFHEVKDTMHDQTHIDRIMRRTLDQSDGTDADTSLLRIADLLHGVVYTHEPQLRHFFECAGVGGSVIDTIIGVAWESQKDSPPETIDGKILHDAHLLEGHENFLVTKSLVTGSVRGQSFEETVDYMELHSGCLPLSLSREPAAE